MLTRIITLSGIFLLLLITIDSTAQVRAVGQPKVLIEGEGNHYMNPVWAPDGQSFAFTAGQFRGIWVADKNGQNVRQLTDKSAGYRFSWTSDSKAILAKVTETVNRRKQSALILYDKDNESQHQLTDYKSGQSALPQWVPLEDKMIMVLGNKIELLEAGKGAIPRNLRSAEIPGLEEAQLLVEGQSKREKAVDVSPFENAYYLNPQVSPDGQKIAFEIYGGNLYVMNVDGTRLTDLGPGNRPQWSPDSRYILANRTTDDGHDITTADIIAFSLDGKEEINLTSSTSLIAMNPSWSPDDKNILFNDPSNGNIYILEISR